MTIPHLPGPPAPPPETARRCARQPNASRACLRSRTTSRLSLSSPPLIGPSYDRDVRRIASGAPTAVIASPDTEM